VAGAECGAGKEAGRVSAEEVGGSEWGVICFIIKIYKIMFQNVFWYST